MGSFNTNYNNSNYSNWSMGEVPQKKLENPLDKMPVEEATVEENASGENSQALKKFENKEYADLLKNSLHKHPNKLNNHLLVKARVKTQKAAKKPLSKLAVLPLIGSKPANFKVSVKVSKTENKVVRITSQLKEIARGGAGVILDLGEFVQKKSLSNDEVSIEDMKNEAAISQEIGYDDEGNAIPEINISHEIDFRGEVSLLQEKADSDGEAAYCMEAYADKKDDIENVKQFMDVLNEKIDTLTKEQVNHPGFKMMEANAMKSFESLCKCGMMGRTELKIFTSNLEDIKRGEVPSEYGVGKMKGDYKDMQNSRMLKNLGKVEKAEIKALKPEEKLSLCRNIGRVYHQHIWGKGIAHLDGKPANLLVKDGKFKVADFGGAIKFADINNETKRGLQFTRVYEHPKFGDAAYAKGLSDTEVQGVIKAQEVYNQGVIYYRILTGGLFPNSEDPVNFIDKQALREKGVPGKVIKFLEKVLDPSSLGPPVSSKKGCPSIENFHQEFEKCFAKGPRIGNVRDGASPAA